MRLPYANELNSESYNRVLIKFLNRQLSLTSRQLCVLTDRLKSSFFLKSRLLRHQSSPFLSHLPALNENPTIKCDHSDEINRDAV